jgi:hypothetical protein
VGEESNHLDKGVECTAVLVVGEEAPVRFEVPRDELRCSLHLDAVS